MKESMSRFRNVLTHVFAGLSVILSIIVVLLLTYVNIEFGETSRYVLLFVKPDSLDAQSVRVRLNDDAEVQVRFSGYSYHGIQISDPAFLSGTYPGNNRRDNLSVHVTMSDTQFYKTIKLKGRHPIYSGDCQYVFYIELNGDIKHSECALISRMSAE